MKTSPRPRTSWRDLRPFLHSVHLENFSTPDRSQCPSQPWGVFALPNSVVKPSSAVGTIRIDPGKWGRGKNRLPRIFIIVRGRESSQIPFTYSYLLSVNLQGVDT